VGVTVEPALVVLSDCAPPHYFQYYVLDLSPELGWSNKWSLCVDSEHHLPESRGRAIAMELFIGLPAFHQRISHCRE